ncbi:MAG: glycosyltransferase family 39 protein, partial [Mariprofundaceae bacterium]
MTAKACELVRHPYAWLLLICAVSFFAALGGHTLWDVDEPNNAVCAREMLVAGNWWVPMFNGDLRFDKPILIYWLMMPLNALFGVNEWTALLPSALGMSGLVLVVFSMTRCLLNHLHVSEAAPTALMAATAFATALHIVVIARAAVPDPLLMLSLGFALPALLLVYLERPEVVSPRATMPGLLVGAYIAIGLGV